MNNNEPLNRILGRLIMQPIQAKIDRLNEPSMTNPNARVFSLDGHLLMLSVPGWDVRRVDPNQEDTLSGLKNAVDQLSSELGEN
tara:strand:+ start:153 stop:404 length:252 start_codon:yes stop_codon:yes gene_type:complete